MFKVVGDTTPQQNGDIAIRSDTNDRLVCLVYAMGMKSYTLEYAQVIAAALNAAYSPSMTDLMVSPEQLDAYFDGDDK